jgi:hypothetical protein
MERSKTSSGMVCSAHQRPGEPPLGGAAVVFQPGTAAEARERRSQAPAKAFPSAVAAHRALIEPSAGAVPGADAGGHESLTCCRPFGWDPACGPLPTEAFGVAWDASRRRANPPRSRLFRSCVVQPSAQATF